MTISDKTICGIAVSSLTNGSKKRVIKTCDVCGGQSETTLDTINKTRRKWLARHESNQSSYLDFCFGCSMKIKNTGNMNASKRQDVRRKISNATRGKSKRFKDGKNPRLCGTKLSQGEHGYVLVHDGIEYHRQHRVVMEQVLQRPLTNVEQVHHIDGDKLNNLAHNLHLCASDVDHSKLHKQLESVAMQAVKSGFIFFDRSPGQYRLRSDLMPRSLGFEDIAIQQSFNQCQSRLDVDTKSEICRGVWLNVPLVASNMSTVVNADFCILLSKYGAMGIMHRAAPDDILIQSAKSMASYLEHIAVSVGVGDVQVQLAKKIIRAGATIVVIDIAHGFSSGVLDTAKAIKVFSPTTKIIVGNFVCPEAIPYFNDYVDGIKLGIAQGLACETKNTAGCTEKQFSAIAKMTAICRDFGMPMISDGGIREPADYTKAIAAGANAVMAGSIFARCPESAAEIVHVDGVAKKVYAGMASRYVQDKWRGMKAGTCPEGSVRYLDIGESVEKLIERYQGALRSGVTYAGGKDIQSFQANVKFIRV